MLEAFLGVFGTTNFALTIGTADATTFQLNVSAGPFAGWGFRFRGSAFTYGGSGGTPDGGTITSFTALAPGNVTIATGAAGATGFGNTSLASVWGILQASGGVAALNSLLNTADAVIGSAFDDTIRTYGTAATPNSVSAGAGDDTVVARSGGSGIGATLDGGADDDLIFFFRDTSALSFVINLTNPAQQTLVDGTKIANFERLGGLLGLGNDTVTGANGVFVDDIQLGGGNNSFNGQGGDDIAQGGAGNDTINGGPDNDTLSGGADLDTLQGGSGDDNLDGEGGGDNLDGGAGNDQMFGGDGNDHLHSRLGEGPSSGGTEIIDGGAGIDFALIDRSDKSISLTLDLGRSSLIGDGTQITNIEFVEFIAGSGNDDLIGGATIDKLTGNAGQDVISGGGSNDLINGGDGVDILSGDAGIDTINGGNGIDILDGGADLDILNGGAGADNLDGGAGDDILDGGLLNDTMTGGLGFDAYFVDRAGDVVNELAGEGFDTVVATVSYALEAETSVERLQIALAAATKAINLTGNELVNELRGNNAANRLDGGGGADTLQGFNGNDTYVIDAAADKVIEVAGGGTADTLLAAVTYKLAAAANIEILRTSDASSTTAINLTGNALVQSLQGNAGINLLNGLAGADNMHGFAGNDTYIVDVLGDKVNEAAGNGSDTVTTSVSYTLLTSAEVELFRTSNAAATTAIKLTGSASAQTIQGNAGANTLDGGAGADTLQGFGGNDTYIVDNADDVVVETAGKGTDTVIAKASYTLAAAANVEKLQTQGPTSTYAVSLTGNALVNTIIGNNGVNIINGGLGSDTLTGGGSIDKFRFDTALGTSNVDKVTDFTFQEKIELDNAVFKGLAEGTLKSFAFQKHNIDIATTAEIRILYQQNTGALYFDKDGIGGADAVQFATIAPGLGLSAANFVVI